MLDPNSGSVAAVTARGSGRWRAAGWWLLVVAVLGVIAAVQTLPSPSQLGSLFSTNPGDPALLMWQLTLQSHDLVHDPTGLVQGNIFWPHDHTLAYSDNLIGFLPVFAPVLAISGDNSILAYNVTAWAGYLLGGVAVYALAAHVLERRLPALIAAVLFAAAPYRSVAVGHVQLTGFLFVPLALLLSMRLIEGRRWLDAVLLGLCVAGAWLTSLYAFEMLVVALLAFAVVWAVLHLRELDLGLLVRLGGAAAAAAVLIAPTLPAYVAVARSGSITRSESDLFTANQHGFTNLPPSAVYRALGVAHEPFFDITGFFPGAVLIALVALAGLLLFAAGPRHRRAGDDPLPPRARRYALPLLAAAGIGVVVMVGPNHRLGVGIPDALLRAVIPGMVDIRDLTRFWLLPLSIIAVVAGAGMLLLSRRITPRLGRGAEPAVAAVIIVVACIEVLFRPYFASIDRDGPAAAVNRALATLPGGPVAELPLPPKFTFAYAFVVAPRQLRSDIDNHPRIEGYSGSIPADIQLAIDWVRALPDPAAVAVLRHGGVRYLLLHGGSDACSGHYSATEMATVEAALRQDPGVDRIIPVGADAIVTLRADPTAVPGSAGDRRAPGVPDRPAPPCDLF